MKELLALLALLLLAGCLDFPKAAESIRKKHHAALSGAAATNLFDSIPPVEASP